MLRISRAKRRHLALITCGTFAAGLVIAQHHRATVAHGYCSAHGAQIHLPAEVGRTAVRAPTTASLHREHAVQGTHGCAILALLKNPSVAPQLRRAQRVGGIPRRPLLPPADPPRPPIAPLREAPKQSPPA